MPTKTVHSKIPAWSLHEKNSTNSTERKPPFSHYFWKCTTTPCWVSQSRTDNWYTPSMLSWYGVCGESRGNFAVPPSYCYIWPLPLLFCMDVTMFDTPPPEKTCKFSADTHCALDLLTCVLPSRNSIKQWHSSIASSIKKTESGILAPAGADVPLCNLYPTDVIIDM